MTSQKNLCNNIYNYLESIARAFPKYHHKYKSNQLLKKGIFKPCGHIHSQKKINLCHIAIKY